MSAWGNEGNATLGEIIAYLKTLPPDQVVKHGWDDCYSYRGYYEDLAFQQAANVTVGTMLSVAESALGETFTGYKGGEYRMGASTDCWLTESHRDTGVPVVLPGKTPVVYVLPEADDVSA